MVDSAHPRRGNKLTVISASLFVGLEAVGTGLAAGWAIAGLSNLGQIGEYVLMALFCVLALYATYRYAQKAAQAESQLTY